MKSKMIDDFKKLLVVVRRYIDVNIEYAKLTAAEKFTMLAGAMAVAVAAMLCAAFMLFFLGFSCAELFKTLMAPALAYLCTAGIFLVLFIIVLLLRRPLLQTPLARFITSILFDKKPKE